MSKVTLESPVRTVEDVIDACGSATSAGFPAQATMTARQMRELKAAIMFEYQQKRRIAAQERRLERLRADLEDTTRFIASFVASEPHSHKCLNGHSWACTDSDCADISIRQCYGHKRLG